MNESRRTIDARGQACPAPVISVKKAFEEGAFDSLEILVDNEAARENVMRFAGYSGYAVESASGEPPAIAIVLKGGPSSASSHAAPSTIQVLARPEARNPESAARPTVLIPSSCIGSGNDALGALLMRGFIYALAEGESKPARIILMNHGVKLASAGSDSLDNMKRLAESGVEILACGTCLEFLGLKDALAVGRVSNMYEIAGLLSSGRVLTV